MAQKKSKREIQSLDEIQTLSDVPFVLRKREEQLLQRHLEVVELLLKGHTSEDAQNLQQAVHRLERDLIVLQTTIGSLRDSSTDMVLRDRLREKCGGLLKQTGELSKRLTVDKKEIKEKEDKEVFDLLKTLTYTLVFPAAAYNLTKSFLPENSLGSKSSPFIIAGAGLGFHFRKNIANICKRICARPISLCGSLKNDFIIYYLTRTLAEKAEAARHELNYDFTLCYIRTCGRERTDKASARFRKGAHAFTERNQRIMKTTKRFVRKVFGLNGPSNS